MDRQPLTTPLAPSSAQVRERFGRRARAYRQHAPLQRAVAWRLAHQLAQALGQQRLEGPAADLGAGPGLLGEALQQQGLHHPLLQLDLCPQLLAENPLARQHGQCLWDLNAGLPAALQGASLLCSSFALQWLADPAGQLERWCGQLAPGGWLAVAVPTAASFPQWRRAAQRAGVPYTGLPLPAADVLTAVAQRHLVLEQQLLLHFSRPHVDGRSFLGSLRAIGAVGSPQLRLGTAGLRRLLQHWPDGEGITWTVLLLIGQRRP